MATTDIRDVIERTQDQILRCLVDLVTKERRPEADRLIDQHRQASKAVAAMTPEVDARYAYCPRAIDAIKLYLNDAGRSADREEIITEVVRRGFRPQDAARTAGNISKSLTMHTEGRAAGRKVLRQCNGQIGLAHWPDSMFPTSS